MNVVITGATGFVGRWLVTELLQQSNRVTVIVRNRVHVPDEWKDRVSIVEATLGELANLCQDNFCGQQVDVFFHLAWDGTSGEKRANVALQLKNIQATCEAVELAGRLNCKRFINAGSIMEYEVIQNCLEDGSMPTMGNIYSTAKMTADFMAKITATKENVDYINVIISNVYGKGERSPRFLNSVMRKMLNNEVIPLTSGKQLYDFIYVTDAVKAIILVAERGHKNSSYYIGNSNQRTLKEFVIEMKNILNSNSELLFGSIPFQGMELQYKDIDTHKLEQLGFVPKVKFAEGVQLTKEGILEEKNEY